MARSMGWSRSVTEKLIGLPGADVSLDDGYALLATSSQPVPDDVVPVAIVDEASVACMVDRSDLALPAGSVVRWHLNEVAEHFQGRLLDVSVVDYLESLERELGARTIGKELMTERIMPEYEQGHLRERIADDWVDQEETEEECRERLRSQVTLDYARPRGEVLRPVRMACQNVVIGLAAMAYDARIDGLAVAAWQTCEVPHVATHEANRALLALTLCDAFATGGTMEVRFDRQKHPHPEGRVPASLARFARTVGIDVFDDGDPGGLSPEQSRALFRACTPMPGRLSRHVDQAVDQGLTSIERICFTILSQILPPVAVEYLLATTERIGSILRGGHDNVMGRALAAELTAVETAMLLGLLVARLESVDNAGASVRVIETQKHPVRWQIDVTTGAVAISAPESPQPTWPGGEQWPHSGEVMVVPRARPSGDLELPTGRYGMPALIVVPSDERQEGPVLHAPVRLSELRADARRAQLSLRSARA